MKPILPLLLTLTLILTGCNMPMLQAPATPTLPPSATPTQPPPTASPTPLPPTQTPLPEPSATAILVTQPAEITLAPTATQPLPTPTYNVPTPISRALFEGTFTGGTLSFRIGGEHSKLVIPKVVILKGAECKGGGKISTSINFEPPPTYEIDEKARFTIFYGSEVSISGVFVAPNRATGTISLQLTANGNDCHVGPLPWVANGG